jgi:hypothetical protein
VTLILAPNRPRISSQEETGLEKIADQVNHISEGVKTHDSEGLGKAHLSLRLRTRYQTYL